MSQPIAPPSPAPHPRSAIARGLPRNLVRSLPRLVGGELDRATHERIAVAA